MGIYKSCNIKAVIVSKNHIRRNCLICQNNIKNFWINTLTAKLFTSCQNTCPKLIKSCGACCSYQILPEMFDD